MNVRKNSAMYHGCLWFPAAAVLLAAWPAALPAQQAGGNTTPVAAEPTLAPPETKSEQPPLGVSCGEQGPPFWIGGVGGVYFLPPPGQLTVDVYKRDRNQRGRHTELRAILFGPDRRVLAEATIPDDGQPRGSGWGPPGCVRLSAEVDETGVYGLNITVSQDRYGESVAWGFRTNCPKYLIETARGHKDERHQEPIVLLDAERPGDVWFLPRPGRLTIDVENLAKGVKQLEVFDSRARRLATLPVSAGRASHTFAAGDRQAVPWRLHLPAFQATVHADGVTRWQPDDPYPNLCYWTTTAGAFFPLLDYRWLITPYQRTVYAPAGAEGSVTFRVHNNSAATRTIDLQCHCPGDPWPVEVTPEQVTLGPKRAAEVTVRFTVPDAGRTHVCRVRATPVEQPEFSTWSTLRIVVGRPPADRPLAIPIVLEPYRHENELFGYLPAYPTESQVYFDLENRPYVLARQGLATRRNGRWVVRDLRSSVVRPEQWTGRPYRPQSGKIAFDRDNHLYLLAATGRHTVLLHSADGGETFSAAVIPGRESQSRSFDIEQFSGHNVPDGPPPILRYTRTGEDPRLIWRKINDLELFLPEKTADGLTVGDPILISRRCIGLSAHSGIPSTVVSRGDKVHVVWAEATEPGAKVPGVPTYVATYDRRRRQLTKPILVGYGPPPNDIHNTPSITMDAEGYLHVLVGTHGSPFPYARSRQPNDSQGGWTEAAPAAEGARQTYIGLVCGPDGTLHSVFRMWRYGEEPFPASVHGTLAYQRKLPGQPWEKPRVLVVPPFSEYSVYYHRLTIDRRGRLFLSYDYWSTYWFYRNDHVGDRRALLMSPDGGKTWKLASDADFN